ncbi:MAG TPA: oligosaccharide flippase family protein [Patescibacteria group bacterium]|nr:oligosaccharide flippase family protein [Patescibacteria group bacterium]
MNNKGKSLYLETLKGTFLLSSWTTVSQLVGIVNSFIVLYLLTVYEYGIYVLVLSVINMSEGALYESSDQLIITDVLIERRRNNLERAKRIYQEYALFKIIMAVVAFAVLFLGAQLIADYLGYDSLGLFIKVGAFMVLFRGGFYFLHINLRINKKFNQMGSFTFIMELIKLLLLLTMFFYFEAGIAKIIFVSVLANLFSFVILLFRNFNDLKHWFSGFKIDFRNLQLWKIMRAHGKWNFATGLVAKFSKNIKPWLMKFFISTEAVAIYNFGKNLFTHLDGLVPVKEVINQLLPDLAQDKERLKRVLLYGSKYVSLLLIAVSLAGMAGAPLFVWLLFPKYLWSLPVFYIFLISEISFGGLGQVASSLLFSLRQQKWLTYIPVLKAFLVIILNALLLPVFGMFGMAWEFTITAFITTLLTYTVAIKKLGLPWLAFVKIFDFDQTDQAIWNRLLKSFKNKFKKTNN